MKIKPFLETKQPIVYKTFCNALKVNRIAHAYLLVGEPGTPLKETALYLAKTLLCDNRSPLACEECVTCARIEKGEYPDVSFLDGSSKSIKKENVSQILGNFEKTALEAKGVMVYVVHHVENMTVEAVNSLLKFLEEPPTDTYAILTTQNEAKVLPTIVSRCETIRLVLLPRNEVIEAAVSSGASLEDAEILSNFYNDGQMVKEEAEEDEYKKAKAGLLDMLNALLKNPSFARYTAEKDVLPLLSSKPATRFYFDMLSLAFQDILNAKVGSPLKLTSYANILSELAMKLPHIEESLKAIMTLRGKIESNVNTGLLINHVVNVITKETI